MSNNNKDVKVGEVTFNNKTVVYHFPLLNLKKKRSLVNQTASLLAPALGAGYSVYEEYRKEEAIRKEYEEDGLEPPESSLDLFSLSAIIGQQVGNPVVEELMDALMEGTTLNGEPYNMEEHDSEEAYAQYMKVVAESFRVNVLGPLVTCLSVMGYSEIVGLAQTVLTTKVPTEQNT